MEQKYLVLFQSLDGSIVHTDSFLIFFLKFIRNTNAWRYSASSMYCPVMSMVDNMKI
jgi:hypothetical protein